MGKRHWYGLGGALGLVIILVLSPISASPVRPTEGKWASAFRPYGGYIDELMFKIYTNTSQAVEALQQGEIDIYNGQILVEDLPALESDPNITVSYTESTGFRQLYLNCDRFPTNTTGYRRAMAFGMDKYKATEEAVGEFGTPLDSFIPTSMTEWTVENDLSTYFYDTDFVSGNASLENAGFKDLDHDGWREYDKNRNSQWDAGIDLDDNDPLLVINLTATKNFAPAVIACTVAHDGLAMMGLRSTVEEKPFWDAEGVLHSVMDGDFWVACFWADYAPWQLPSLSMYESFRTGAISNDCRFSNATIDAVLDKMHTATTLDDKKKYCRDANLLLTFEQPAIVIYNDMNIDAYRTDKFEGYFDFKGYGILDNYFRNTQVRLKESAGGPYGGTFKINLPTDLPSKNPFNITTADLNYIFDNIFSILWYPDPNTWGPIPVLAHDWDIERTPADPAAGIQEGQKFTFYLVENATWHDGQPVTSEDVYYSFELMKNHVYWSKVVPFMYKKEMPNNHTFVIYNNKTDDSAWVETCTWIYPWHIWKDAVNLTDFLLLPDFIPSDAHLVGSGPFRWNERSPGKHISLLRHKDWHWAVPHEPEPTTTSSPESSSKSTTSAHGFELVSVFAVGVIAVTHIKRRRKRT